MKVLSGEEMTVYIEYAFLDNLLLDYALLSVAIATLRVERKRWIVFLSALIGTAFALITPYLSLSVVFLTLYKLLVGALMVWTAISVKRAKTYFLLYALFLGYTFAAGGLIFGVFSVFGVSASETGAVLSTLPVGVICAVVYVFVLLVKRVVKMTERRRITARRIYKCEIETGGKRYPASGLFDSGNALYDQKSGNPVVVLSRDLASRFFVGFSAMQTPARFLEFSTLSGKSKMLIFEIDKLWIYYGAKPNIIERVTVGLSPTHFRGNEEYDVILHPALVGEGENV